MNNYILIILCCFMFSCTRPVEKYPDVKEQLAEVGQTQEKGIIFVFDEYACSVCMDNVLHEINIIKEDYIVLYSTMNPEKYNYQNSILNGYVDESKISPVNNEIVSVIRKATETIKGNYKIEINKKMINNIKNY